MGTQLPPEPTVHLGWVGKDSKEGGSSSPSVSQAGQEPAASWGKEPH